jgi:2-methylisocitrate lyase-like PEP mutase family enzyme
MNATATNTTPRRALREALSHGLVVAPFVYDGLTARIAEKHGFSAVYMTGHGTAAQAGFPDLGLISFKEMVTNLRYIADAVSIPVIADSDTGYGNPLNVARTIREYERAGAAALHMEDQTSPKKCGFFEGKAVIPVDEYLAKLRSALDARIDPDLVIIARTDALAVNGWADVENRCHRYREAGADFVFVDGIKSADDLEQYTQRIVSAGIPALYNGGLEPAGKIAERGFGINITGGGHGLSYMAVKRAMTEALAEGRHAAGAARLDFGSITDLLGLPEVYELERQFAFASPNGRH